MAQHRLEALIRASVAAVVNVTGESLTDLGRALGLAKVLVSRRQRGGTPWTVAELGDLTDHWQIDPCLLLAGPSASVAGLRLDRVNELRHAKGLPALSELPSPSAAPIAA
jgi:hypothetical protein